jgi:multiple sugar transport system substrate-binding protein
MTRGQARAVASDSRRLGTRRRAVLVAAAVSLLLAACGGDEDGAAEDDAASSSDGPVTLTVWVGRETTVPPDQFESIEEDYGVQVEYSVVDWGEAFEQLVRMRDAGQPMPDVVQVDGFFVPGLYEAGIVQDIGEYRDLWEEEDPDSFNQLADVVWTDGQWDGVQVGMADISSMDQMFYRPDWFEEDGLAIPETQDELLDLMRTLKDQRPDSIPYSLFAARGNGANFFITHMAAAGVEFDGAIPQLESEAGEYVIDFYQTVVREGLTSEDVLAWGSDEARGAYIGGNAAMLVESIGIAEELRPIETMNCNEQWALFDIPTSRSGGDDGVNVATAKNWVITSDSEHPYEASLVLRYLMADEQALGIAMVGEIPRHTGVLENEEFQEQFECFMPHVETFMNSAPFSIDTNFFAVEGVLELMIQDIVSNPDEPPSELAARWQTELDATAP